MPGSVNATPTFALQPAAERVALSSNYITNFNFLSQYLPDTYEKEFERYGNRSVASFLRMVGAEMPSASDQITWAEQGRLHIKYTNVTSAAAINSATANITVADTGAASAAVRVGQTIFIQNNASGVSNRAIVTAINVGGNPLVFTIGYYESGGQAFAVSTQCSMFIYGSEFTKGTSGMGGSLESEPDIYNNKPIILKDRYAVSGSDMAQIGWVEVTSENGASGYLWYLKSQHDARLRFEDYLETSMIEAVPAPANSGAAQFITGGATASAGTQGVFHVVNTRGNVWGGGNPATLSEWDTLVARLDRQGAIEENVVFCNRSFSFDIDNFLAGLNGLVGAPSGANNINYSQGASFGLFDNDVQMALNLGFSGFRRGYDFYKSDWKYLNDATMRGGLVAAGTGTAVGSVNGLLVPAGSTTVYDQILGKNAKRPFLHVRYRASEAEDRRYKTWITGSAGGAATSDLDAMEVNFLSERCVCTLGANNFFLFRWGA